MCSGVWPGVCSTFAATLPSSSTSPSRTPWNGKVTFASANSTYSAAALRQLAAGRDMVGMKVRVDDVVDAHAGGLAARR